MLPDSVIHETLKFSSFLDTQTFGQRMEAQEKAHVDTIQSDRP